VIPTFEATVAAGEDGRFGGLVIQNRPAYRVVVLLTAGGLADLDRYPSFGQLRDLVEVRHVARTYDQLKAAQIDAMRLKSVEFNSDIDVLANEVKLYVDGVGAPVAEKARILRAEAASSAKPLPSWVVVQQGPSVRRALDVFGGLALSSCTSGFSVTGPGGSGGVTTAAHCPNSLSYAGHGLEFKGEHFAEAFDIQWHSKPSTNFPAKIYRGQGVYGAISGKKARWNQPIGATVCKRGKTTDRTCGTIESKDFEMPPPNSGATFITATFTVGGGDSGGPVFVGEEAWGTVVAQRGLGETGPGVYMAANYIESSNQNLYIRGT